MHISTFLPLSLSLVSSVLAQAQRSVISINVGAATGVGALPAAGAQPTAGAVGPEAQPGPKGSVITIRPEGAGAAATALPQQGQQGAQGAPGSPSPAGSPGAIGQQPGQAATGGAPVWVVKVGSERNDLVFSPNTVTAKPGEFVQFQFFSRNHSVASSAFETPCVPNTNDPARAFFSGFMPTEAQGQLTYTVPVRDTNPIWIYCTQARHCQDGMVGVINPPAGGGQTLQAYQAAAAQAPNNVVPNGGAAVGGTAAGIGSGTVPGSPAVAQSTAGAVSIIARRASWELLGAAMVAWFLL